MTVEVGAVVTYSRIDDLRDVPARSRPADPASEHDPRCLQRLDRWLVAHGSRRVPGVVVEGLIDHHGSSSMRVR